MNELLSVSENEIGHSVRMFGNHRETTEFWVKALDDIHIAFDGDWGCNNNYYVANWMHLIPSNGVCVELSDLSELLQKLALPLVNDPISTSTVIRDHVRLALGQSQHREGIVNYLAPEIACYKSLIADR